MSANADGPRDAAPRNIDHIALPTEYNYQATSVVDSKLYTKREMSVITTYLNDNAQTPLNRFVVYICYTSKFAINTVKNRTDRA